MDLLSIVKRAVEKRNLRIVSNCQEVHVKRALLKTIFVAGLSLWCANLRAQQSGGEIMDRARHEFRDGKYSDAERDFRHIVTREPSNVYALFFLGQSLFNQRRYNDSIKPYEQALALQNNTSVLSLDQRRILGDQLAMAYGVSGELLKARSLLQSAVKTDPDYPLNYYNLACTFAESGDRDRMLVNLSLAFKHKQNMLKGERLPDPKSDSSFHRYLRDQGFIRLMKEVGADSLESIPPQ
jgi:predicted Zn-dependent protease